MKSAAERWGVAERKVTDLCPDKLIIGAKKTDLLTFTIFAVWNTILYQWWDHQAWI